MTRKGSMARGGRRALTLAGAAALAAVGQFGAMTTGFADTVVACATTATVDFTPNGPGASSDFGWTMQGYVGGCQSNASGTASSGAVSVGEPLRVSVPITLANGQVVQGTAAYQESPGDGSSFLPDNSCASSDMNAFNAFVQWSDGTITELTLNIVNVGALAQFEGFVFNGAVLPLIPGTETPPGTAPATYQVVSDNPNLTEGSQYSGAAVVTRADALDCTTTQGLHSAQVVGAVQFGESLNIPRP